MLQEVSPIITYGFIATTLLSVALFMKASKFNRLALMAIFGWLGIHGILAGMGFFLETEIVPPRFILVFIPVFLLFIVLFNIKKGKAWIDSLDPGMLTILHIVRIPVELILYGLFLEKAVPELMTFAGRNFDILAGITAPFIYYFGFVKNQL